jgi:RND family efflux transporter MFP subunit
VTKNIFIISLLSILMLSCGSQGPAGGSGGSQQANGRQRGQGQGEQSAQKALSVRAFKAEKRPISTYILSNTTLEAIRNITVYAKLNAIVSEMRVEEGDILKKGQVLLKLDEREIRNDHDQAAIALGQAELAVRQAEVRAELSAAEFERAKSLYDQKLTSKQEYDQADLTSRTDDLALEDAKQQQSAAKARLEAAQIQLEYTTVVSPIDGVVTDRLTDVGDRVNTNEELFSIREFPPLWARIYVPEKALPQLKMGQSAGIRVETYPEREFTGRIKMINPAVDAASGTVKVTIEVTRPGNLLRPGMFGTVSIATDTHPDAVVIPKKSIVRERDLNFVFVIQPDNTVQRREIETGFAEDAWIEILSGLNEGDSIVSVGHETLNEGYPIMVQTWENAGPEGEQPAAPQAPKAEPVQHAQGGPGSGGAGQVGLRAGPVGTGGPGGGGGRGEFFQRLLENPEVRKRYEAKLKEDPELATDPQKRRAFAREVMSELRGAQ